MVTTKNPYQKKVGKNLANHFLAKLNENNMYLASYIFMDNERAAVGRRVAVAIAILEGKTLEDIMLEVGVAKGTVARMKRQLSSVKNEERVLRDLKNIYKNQFVKYPSRKKYPNIFEPGGKSSHKIYIIKDEE